VTRSYGFLEHTADVGIRARGDTLAEVFVAAAEGLAELLGAWFPGGGEHRRIDLEAPDLGALLVAWLDELIFLHEAEDLVFGGFAVEEVRPRRVAATAVVTSRGDRRLQTPGVKATTYHRLRVVEEEGAWVAEVYLDV
jgi:SHS2 domain-containing protein